MTKERLSIICHMRSYTMMKIGSFINPSRFMAMAFITWNMFRSKHWRTKHLVVCNLSLLRLAISLWLGVVCSTHSAHIINFLPIQIPPCYTMVYAQGKIQDFVGGESKQGRNHYARNKVSRTVAWKKNENLLLLRCLLKHYELLSH